MHLYMRVTDKFTNYIIDELFSLDGYQDLYDSESDPKISKSRNIYKYIKFLTDDCKIRNCFHLKDKKIKFRELRGNEKLIVFSLIDLVELFPTINDVFNKNDVMCDFHSIYLSIRDNNIDSDEIERLTSQFLIEYSEAFMITTITPYLHCFICHLHEFRKLHGDFNLFNQQGLEKLNDITSEQVFLKERIEKERKTEKVLFVNSL